MLEEPTLACSVCGARHSPSEVAYVCPACGPEGILEFVREARDVASLPVDPLGVGMWRYVPLLPVSPVDPRPPLAVGATPLYHTPQLGQRYGLPSVYVKDDTRNPSGSLKDRASALVLARAAAIGVHVVTTASTGNAASSLAALAASMQMSCVIFVPAAAPHAKIVQSLAYGAIVFAVDGSYDDAFELCIAASRTFGWFNRNTAYNPYTIEGKKTVGFEIFEQLGGRAPDAIVVPTGDGCILSGVARAFTDLLGLDLIRRRPRIAAVQAAGSAAIARAWVSGSIKRVSARSVADSITVDLPRNGRMAVRDIHESDGVVVTVDDTEILAAIPRLAGATGVFAEPAAAASLAGFEALAARGWFDEDAIVILLVTGTGLKDVDGVARAVGEPLRIKPTLDDIAARLPSGLTR